MLANQNDAWRSGAHVVILAALVLLMMAIEPGRVHADPDVTAPDAPTGLFVDGGSSWRATNSFRIWWHNPQGQETPVAIAHYEVCPAVPPGPCTTHQASGLNISELQLVVPSAGGFWFRVWLEDGAGNVDSNAKSPQVILRFDDGIPPEPVFGYDGVWQGKDTPVSPNYAIGVSPGSEWPVSGIRGYSITTNGAMPDSEVEIFALQDYETFQAVYAMQHLSEGVTAVGVRSVSNAGIASDGVRSVEIRLDRSAPVIDAGGLPSSDRWHLRPLSVPLRARDQVHLSGVVPAPLESPLEDGAHLEYELDGGPTMRLRGGEGYVAVAADGRHTLTYRAFDVAGNASVQKEAVFKIDGTAPVGSFRALNPADPRQLKVDVADATSGVADGRIEYRREGESGFTRLATTHAAGVLSGRLDDEALPAGRYELRAVVTDVAGNEAVIDGWADGSAVAIGMPLRLEAKLTAVGNQAIKRCTRGVKKRRGKGRRRKRAARRKCSRKTVAKRSLQLGHGKRAKSTGRLATGHGAPIGNASIVVEGQSRSGGGFVRVGTARTDTKGEFRFTIPTGPSRTVRYRYDGTNTVKPAAAEIVTKVRAAARLKVNRRRLRNGQSVRFTGRLLGKPIPSAGKLVALQARVGRGWRTFATPRANAKGVFKRRYRFTATTGLRRYAFRAVIAREAAYPYEAGVSRIVRVTVRGRR